MNKQIKTSTFASVLLAALLFSPTAKAGTESRCREQLQSGGWEVAMSGKYNSFDIAALVVCVVSTWGAGAPACLHDLYYDVAGNIGADLLKQAVQNEGQTFAGPGGLEVQAGKCSKTYPVVWGIKDTDHYFYVRWRVPGEPVPANENTLQWFHSGCSSSSLANTIECTAAIHRFVVNNGHGDAGVSQELGANEVGLLGFGAEFYGAISIVDLHAQHNDCVFPYAQSNACVSAIHRTCLAFGYHAGMAQEVGDQVYGVACTNVELYTEISYAELRSHHMGCDGDGQSNECRAAIHRACNQRGFAGGFAQELGITGMGVACLNGSYTAAKIN